MKKIHILSIAASFLLAIQACASKEQVNNRVSSGISSNNGQAAISSSSQKISNSVDKFDKIKADKLTDTAKLLAGIKVSENSPLFKVTQVNSWNTHQNFLNI